MARKRKEPELTEESPAAGVAGLAGATVLLAALIVAAFFAWKQWARPALNLSHYQLVAENVAIPPAPPWIRSDIKAEVFRDASLAESSTLDKDLTRHVAQAFELHPWIAEVNRVSKQAPSNVVVDLDYRRPIAWVEVPPGMFGQQGHAALPIDGESVLLPQNDFSPEDLDSFIRIDVEELPMSGPTGSPWGDPSVAGAAAIAKLVGENWKDLGLYRIKAITDYSQLGTPAAVRYELFTPKSKRMIWGSAPGLESPGEPEAVQKFALLQHYVKLKGKLDDSDTLSLDLRNPETIKTALLPR